MRYNVYIDFTSAIDILPENGVYSEIFPDNVNPFPLSTDNSSGQISQFFVRMLWGVVQLSNNPKLFASTGLNAYRLFKIVYNLSFSQRILLKYTTDNNTIYGYFGRNDCNFDYDKKILKVTPAIFDEYTDVFENWENDVDFNNYEFVDDNVTVKIANSSLITKEDWPWEAIHVGGAPVTPRNRVKEKDYDANGELGVYFDGQKPKDELFDDPYWEFGGTHKILPVNEFGGYANYSLGDRVEILGQVVTPENRDNVPSEHGDWELSLFRIYEGTRVGGLFGNRWRQLYCQTEFSRDEEIKVDEVDASEPYGFIPPIGNGWNMRKTRISNGKNAHLWTRKPFNGAYSEDWELQPDVESNGNGRIYDWNWYKYRETKLVYDNSERSFDLVTTIGLREFFDYLIQNTDTILSGKSVKSTFFFNDDEGALEVLVGTTGYNYVTGRKNYLNNQKVFFTRDLLTSEEEGEIKSIPKFTLKKVLNDFHKVFCEQLIWFVEGDYIRIEHERYSDLKKGSLDISGSRLLNFTSQWNYDKKLMFERFEYRQINAGYVDFTDNLVVFDKIISNNRNQDLKHEVETRYVSTDAKYCILNPNDISSGIILLAVDDDNIVMNKVGAISNNSETNGYMALSNLLLDFGRYSGVWHYGTMNNRLVNFVVTHRNKLGINLKVEGAKISLFYTTQIGVGKIDSGSVDFENENTDIKLRYRYNSSVNGDSFVIAFQKQTDFVGAVNTWADIENYIN